MYLVPTHLIDLLRIHLRYIHAHTVGDYTIHAVIIRSDPRVREILTSDERVVLHEFEAPILRINHEEHAWYLDRLLEKVLEGDYTHIAVFDPDAFPIEHGWNERLEKLIGVQTPVVSILESVNGDTLGRVSSSALFALRGAFDVQGMRFTLGSEVRESPEFQEFMGKTGQLQIHTGVSIAWRLEQLGWEWLPLLRTNMSGYYSPYAAVYQEGLFHLGASSRGSVSKFGVTRRCFPQDLREVQSSFTSRIFHAFGRMGEKIPLANLFHSWLQKYLPLNLVWWFDRGVYRSREHEMYLQKLLRNPEEFFANVCVACGVKD